MLGFTLAASILTGLLCGVVPALRATDVQLDAAKKLGTRGLSAESRCNTQRFLWHRRSLLFSSCWSPHRGFLGGLRYLALLNLGYDQDEVVTVWVRPELAGYPQEQLSTLHRRLVESLEALLGSQSASYAMCGLASGCRTSSSITIAGYQPSAGENVQIQETVSARITFRRLACICLQGAISPNRTKRRLRWSRSSISLPFDLPDGSRALRLRGADSGSGNWD